MTIQCGSRYVKSVSGERSTFSYKCRFREMLENYSVQKTQVCYEQETDLPENTYQNQRLLPRRKEKRNCVSFKLRIQEVSGSNLCTVTDYSDAPRTIIQPQFTRTSV